MLPALASLATAAATLAALAAAKTDADLVGTWSTKSGAVLTGPGFYDPATEEMHEPTLTGTSYSFTADGFYEEAIYLAIANPAKPTCPKAIIQWQHGSYTLFDNGSLALDPIKIDGRQLYSDPCASSKSQYTRYNQTEFFKSYEVLIDGYSKKQRLNLYGSDGAPANPMYIAYRPPQMLPTITLNPTSTASATASSRKEKRGEQLLKRKLGPTLKTTNEINSDRWFWIGIFMTGLGAVGYFCV